MRASGFTGQILQSRYSETLTIFEKNTRAHCKTRSAARHIRIIHAYPYPLARVRWLFDGGVPSELRSPACKLVDLANSTYEKTPQN